MSVQAPMELSARVERAAGRRPVSWTRVERGYTLTERWVVAFEDGSSAFVKGATSDDLARWIRIEHGVPEPDEVLPGEGELACVIAGYFASLAGLPPPAGAPFVRPLQLEQLRVTLPWTIRELGLEPLGLG